MRAASHWLAWWTAREATEHHLPGPASRRQEYVARRPECSTTLQWRARTLVRTITAAPASGIPMKTLLLNKQDVGRLISMREVIRTVEEAYWAFNSGQVIQPAYTCIHLPPPRGEIDFKLGYCEANEIISMKASSGGFPNNPTE